MWNSVANLKESLNQIANGVHNDDDEELSMYTPPRGRDRFSNGISFPEKRISSDFSGSVGQTGSPHQIEHYTAEIKRLQESEAEIKALSVNYAALLKEKEDQISRLSQENDSLKENLITTNAALVASKTRFKENGDISPTRDHKAVAKIRGSGRLLSDGNLPKNNGLSSGTTSDNAKDTLRTVGVKDRSIPVIQQAHEAQIKELTMELDKERGKLSSMEIRLQEEQKLNGSLQLELNSLKEENNKISSEVHRVFDELNQKALEIGRLQTELQGKNQEQTQGALENLKKVIARLEDENRNIKKEKADIEAALKVARPHPAQEGVPADVDSSNMQSDSVDGASQREEEMRQSLRKLERDLQEASRERDKARKELNRLKQHLLQKESEESEKMDEDSKIIEELRAVNEQQRTQISHLERTVKQANDRQEEMKMFQTAELMKAKENISELDKKLSSCLNTIHAKNTEINNLQMALGQYYAEIEAKERLAEELSARKEELARLSSRLQEILQQAEASNMEKEQILGKLSQAEKILSDGKKRANKLEEDNEKLRRALEQSMTRLNRMSVDSDFLVDRRIVIKLLVTYFQRNHSKEVLDLMVRMLGFSAEDKQRIGIAQQGSGKGLVRGVFGLPGRLVGGMLSSGPSEANATMTSDNQSFADLWVDFLLKENERERSESDGPLNSSTPTHKPTGANSPLTSNRGSTSSPPDLSIPTTPYLYQTQMAPSSRGNFLQRES